MKYKILSSLIVTSLCGTIHAQNATPDVPAIPVAPGKVAAVAKSPQLKEQEKLAAENALHAEKVKKDLAELRTRVSKLKLEKEALTEELAIAALKRNKASEEADVKFAAELKGLTQTAEISKIKAVQVASELKIKQTEWSSKSAELEAQITALETQKKRDAYANAKPVYLDNPLKADGTLVISDRRISMNGAVTMTTAEHVTTRINYYNNNDNTKPIFIVIDASPGGSVMAGYRILKAMEGSTAPVYVVVKSFAASMAATICTLAEKSYAYPNAVILHHQISSTIMFANLNLTEQKEFYEESQQWWKRLATPIANKMGITTEELIKKMYAKTTSGDWTEFGTEAQKLKWVDHIVERIHETSLLKNPDAKKPVAAKAYYGLTEVTDEKGKPCMYLPRLTPKDCYFLYNRDGYYRMK
ncbi:MAG: ATP-dependent Clp protease proteolytic subunit [Akkermansiaceae bacterium]|tara:strand:- start:181 stop:1425 length:1245 start_codon:yes stop_codon:yes gene_type:complete